MKTILILAITAFLNTITWARLGETPAQCSERYGEPFKIVKENQTAFYRKAGMIIMAQFWNGTAGAMYFQKAETDVLHKPVAMTEAEMNALMEANGNGSKWIKPKGTFDALTLSWVTESMDRVASYSKIGQHLIISTDKFNAHIADEKAAQEKKNLQGF